MIIIPEKYAGRAYVSPGELVKLRKQHEQGIDLTVKPHTQ
jgi:hypothetical protein